MTDAIHHPTSSLDMIKLLAIKDLQIYQKPLAGFVVGMILALGLIGTGKSWPFAAGSLLLLVLLLGLMQAGAAAPVYGWIDVAIAIIAGILVTRWTSRK